jgi:carbon monoxide dehydrogenase subunit G
MSTSKPSVWEFEYTIETSATPDVLWTLLSDVERWPQWNAGVEKIEINGPFLAGTVFVMTPPGQEAITTRLVEVQKGKSFLDETRLGELRIFVDHRLEPLTCGRTRIVYSIEAFGPNCDEVGQAVSADFPSVLQALAALAEAESANCPLCVR